MFQKGRIVCDVIDCQDNMSMLDSNAYGWRWHLGKYHLCPKHVKMIDEDKKYKPIFKNH